MVKQLQAGQGDAIRATREFWLKVGGGVALLILLLAFVYWTPEKDRAEPVKQILAALIAAIPTAFAAFFAGKNSGK